MTVSVPPYGATLLTNHTSVPMPSVEERHG
jgi:hypothetical protein